MRPKPEVQTERAFDRLQRLHACISGCVEVGHSWPEALEQLLALPVPDLAVLPEHATFSVQGLGVPS